MKALFILVLSINNVNFVLGRTLAAALASASAATASPVNDLVAAEEPPTARVSLRRRVSNADHRIRQGTIAGSALPSRNFRRPAEIASSTTHRNFCHLAQRWLGTTREASCRPGAKSEIW